MGEASVPVERRRTVLSWVKNWIANPLLVKEMRGRMRGTRAFIVLTTYLLLLSCFTSIIYILFSVTTGVPGGGLGAADAGKVIFYSVVLIEIFMVAFITPGFTSGAISGEKERGTYEVLRTTLLPARKLVLGKFSSALVYLLLLILTAVPLESLAFVLGGVVIAELALALLVLGLAAAFFAALGLFFSSITRSTLASTILTYVVSLLITIGLPILALVFFPFLDPAMMGLGSTTSWMLEALLMYALILVAAMSPLTTAVVTEIFLVDSDALFYFMQDVGGYSSSSGVHSIPVPSPWIVYIVLYVGMILFLLLLAILRVRRQAKV